MTEEQIIDRFNEIMSERGVGRKLGISKEVVYGYRNRPTSLGTKLDVLFKMDQLRFKDGWD
jgi:hypothetical protein